MNSFETWKASVHIGLNPDSLTMNHWIYVLALRSFLLSTLIFKNTQSSWDTASVRPPLTFITAPASHAFSTFLTVQRSVLNFASNAMCLNSELAEPWMLMASPFFDGTGSTCVIKEEG